MTSHVSVLLKTAPLVLALGLPMSAGAQAPVEESGNLADRVARLEQMVNSQTLIELLDSVQALQREVQNLRGEVELQGHTLSQLRERQRELYLDIDRRLQRMETGQSDTAAAGPSINAAAAPTPPPGGAQGGTSAGSAPSGQPPAAGAAPVDPIEEQRAYQAAFDLLKTGRYEQAAQAFSDFLGKYPSGDYADNANYWLAEAYYVTRKFEPALKQFESLISEFPQSQKLTHALLKMGYIHDELGQREEAVRVLDDLIQRFPDSTAAGLARKRLQQIRSG